MNKFMQQAIKQAEISIKNNEGGPFGSVIVLNNKVVGVGHNQVVKNNDCTCHGEMQAIRDASKNLNTFDLSNAELYTTAEPCPMCLGACLWANINKIYYGCTIQENELIGFRDNIFYKNFKLLKNPRKNLIQIDHDECLKLFGKYAKIKNKTMY